MTPHGCPHCRCDWELCDDAGRINRAAPFFPLVELVDSIPDADPRIRGGATGHKFKEHSAP